MFRVVLDSNVLARAVMSPNGLAADLLKRLVQSENQLCTSDFMLSELVRVLSYPRLQKRHKLDDQMTEVVRYCESHGVTVLNDLALLNTLRDAD